MSNWTIEFVILHEICPKASIMWRTEKAITSLQVIKTKAFSRFLHVWAQCIAQWGQSFYKIVGFIVQVQIYGMNVFQSFGLEQIASLYKTFTTFSWFVFHNMVHWNKIKKKVLKFCEKVPEHLHWKIIDQ